MTNFTNLSRVRRLLCVGAHCDDIEIGAGGTVLRLAREAPGVEVLWVVLCGADAVRRAEAERAAGLFLEGVATRRVLIDSFRDAHLPAEWAKVKSTFESIKNFSPDLIFTHTRDDAHQDHRLVNELTWNTFRDHAILEYEIPKYDGDLGRPNAFSVIDRDAAAAKVSHLQAAFASQASKRWFDEELIRSLMRIRGMECQSPTGYAEAFHARKWML